MIDDIVYGTNNSYSESPIKFTFSFDLKQKKSNVHEITDFLNKGGVETSLHFNY